MIEQRTGPIEFVQPNTQAPGNPHQLFVGSSCARRCLAIARVIELIFRSHRTWIETVGDHILSDRWIRIQESLSHVIDNLTSQQEN